MGHNPYVDEDGKCLNCGTGQLEFDGRSTGCACSRVADAEYEEMERIIKLLGSVMTDLAWDGATIKKAIALIKGENK